VVEAKEVRNGAGSVTLAAVEHSTTHRSKVGSQPRGSLRHTRMLAHKALTHRNYVGVDDARARKQPVREFLLRELLAKLKSARGDGGRGGGAEGSSKGRQAVHREAGPSEALASSCRYGTGHRPEARQQQPWGADRAASCAVATQSAHIQQPTLTIDDGRAHVRPHLPTHTAPGGATNKPRQPGTAFPSGAPSCGVPEM
jgi:hypothetical protein